MPCCATGSVSTSCPPRTAALREDRIALDLDAEVVVGRDLQSGCDLHLREAGIDRRRVDARRTGERLHVEHLVARADIADDTVGRAVERVAGRVDGVRDARSLGGVEMPCAAVEQERVAEVHRADVHHRHVVRRIVGDDPVVILRIARSRVEGLMTALRPADEVRPLRLDAIGGIDDGVRRVVRLLHRPLAVVEEEFLIELERPVEARPALVSAVGAERDPALRERGRRTCRLRRVVAGRRDERAVEATPAELQRATVPRGGEVDAELHVLRCRDGADPAGDGAVVPCRVPDGRLDVGPARRQPDVARRNREPRERRTVRFGEERRLAMLAAGSRSGRCGTDGDEERGGDAHRHRRRSLEHWNHPTLPCVLMHSDGARGTVAALCVSSAAGPADGEAHASHAAPESEGDVRSVEIELHP